MSNSLANPPQYTDIINIKQQERIEQLENEITVIKRMIGNIHITRTTLEVSNLSLGEELINRFINRLIDLLIST